MADTRVFCALQIVRNDGNVTTVPLQGTLVPGVLTGLDGVVMDDTFAIAAGAKADIYDLDLANWEAMIVISDLDDVELEVQTDKGADVGTEQLTFQLKADFPFLLGSEVSYANYTTDFAGGTLDKIERLRANNPSTTNTAYVRRVVVT